MTSPLSKKTKDKLHACVNQSWAETDYFPHKAYYDACIVWFDSLKPEQQAIGLAVIQAFSIGHRTSAKRLAADLPSAPVCPAALMSPFPSSRTRSGYCPRSNR